MYTVGLIMKANIQIITCCAVRQYLLQCFTPWYLPLPGLPKHPARRKIIFSHPYPVSALSFELPMQALYNSVTSNTIDSFVNPVGEESYRVPPAPSYPSCRFTFEITYPDPDVLNECYPSLAH